MWQWDDAGRDRLRGRPRRLRRRDRSSTPTGPTIGAAEAPDRGAGEAVPGTRRGPAGPVGAELAAYTYDELGITGELRDLVGGSAYVYATDDGDDLRAGRPARTPAGDAGDLARTWPPRWPWPTATASSVAVGQPDDHGPPLGGRAHLGAERHRCRRLAGSRRACSAAGPPSSVPGTTTATTCCRSQQRRRHLVRPRPGQAVGVPDGQPPASSRCPSARSGWPPRRSAPTERGRATTHVPRAQHRRRRPPGRDGSPTGEAPSAATSAGLVGHRRRHRRADHRRRPTATTRTAAHPARARRHADRAEPAPHLGPRTDRRTGPRADAPGVLVVSRVRRERCPARRRRRARVAPSAARSTGACGRPSGAASPLGLVLTITLVAFEALAISTVMPVVSDDLGGLGLYGWVFSALLPRATCSASSPPGGWPTSGAPRVPFALGLALFAVGLVVGGLAPSMGVLVAARVAQGDRGRRDPGGRVHERRAGLPRPLRPRVFAVFSSAWVVPGLIGPAASSGIAHAIGWRACSSRCSRSSRWPRSSRSRRSSARSAPPDRARRRSATDRSGPHGAGPRAHRRGGGGARGARRGAARRRGRRWSLVGAPRGRRARSSASCPSGTLAAGARASPPRSR